VTDISWVIHFLGAFWTTVVVQCAKPANWEYCFPVTPWIIPWVHDVIHMKEDGPYYEQKVFLDQRSSSATPD